MRWIPLNDANLVDALDGAHEQAVLDFKERYDLTNLDADDTRFEMAKDIAAFANNIGGTIVVGAVEDRRNRRIARFESLQDAARTLGAIDEALRLCLPVPLANGEIVELAPADQHRILLRPAGNQIVSLLLINVPPFLNGPVAVKVWDRQQRGAALADAYRFPLRGAEGTRFLRPEELTMIMNSHDRRIALRLANLAPETPVSVWGRSPDSVSGGRAKGHPCRFVRVDHDEGSLYLKSQREPDLPDAVVPLIFVQALWRVDNGWNIAIDGDVFLLDSAGRTGFQPPMPAYRQR